MANAARWIWVSLPYATYGIAVADGKVVDAAPIARWMIGKPEVEVAAWLRRKGAKVVPLDSPPARDEGYCWCKAPTTWRRSVLGYDVEVCSRSHLHIPSLHD